MALVRPTVEYALRVWSPHVATLSNPVEVVQRRGARYVMSRYGTFDMLRELSWDTLLLEQRRLKAKVTMCFRITNDLVMISANQIVPHTSDTRGHDKKFQPISASRDYYKNTFPQQLYHYVTLSRSL